MLNTGFSIKATEHGYFVEWFRMNSCTFATTVIDERGPYQTFAEAEAWRSVWHKQIGLACDRELEKGDLFRQLAR